MEDISNIRQLIGLWSKRAIAAEAINAVEGGYKVTRFQVDKWAENGAIPAKYHLQVIAAARASGFDVTADLLVRLHAGADLVGLAESLASPKVSQEAAE